MKYFSAQRRLQSWHRGLPSSTHTRRQCACKASQESNSEFLRRAQDLLKENPEAMKAVQRMDAAADKVAELQAKQIQLQQEAERQEKAAAAAQGKRVQDALQQVSELETKAAENAVEAAQLETELLANEREAMLQELVRSNERLESGKAGAIAVAGGAVGLLPSGLVQQYPPVALFLTVSSGLAACALFGILYRYVVAGDPQNSQDWTLPVLASSALSVGQSLLMFAFAAAAIEAATSAGVVRRVGDP